MYRVAFVGCGGIASAHAGGYAEAPECRIVAAADVSPEALDRFAERYQVEQRFTDYDAMLASVRPDIVSICTWPPLHAVVAIAAARSGARGILCEKPMALNLAEADAMNAAAKEHGTVLIVGHQRRFDSRYARARAFIADGAIGRLEELQAECAGDLWSDGVHAVDLLRFLAGDLPVAWVFGQIDRRPPAVARPQQRRMEQRDQVTLRYGHPIESGGIAHLQFEGGPRALLETGSAARPLGYQRLRVTGSAGRLDISGDPRPDSPAFLRIWSRGSNDWQEEPLAPTNAFAEEIRALLQSIEQGTPHPLSGDSARNTLEVLVGIMESAFRQERVTLPLDVRDHPLMRG